METSGFGMDASRIPPMDVERLRGQGMRLYLKQQLRSLEAQIAVLSFIQDEASEMLAEQPFWEEDAARRRKWDKLLELEYLKAVREALLETLARL